MKNKFEFDKNELKRENKEVVLSIRVTLRASQWMSENNISPSKLFSSALDQLMEE